MYTTLQCTSFCCELLQQAIGLASLFVRAPPVFVLIQPRQFG